MKKPAKKSSLAFEVSPSDLRINRGDLDGEIVRQPELIYHVGMMLARAISRRDAAKAALREKEARLRTLLRKKGQDAGPRLSEARLNEVADSHKSLRPFQEAHALTVVQVNETEALYEAMKARGYALRELAQFEMARIHGSSLVRDPLAESRRTEMSAKRRRS